MLGLKNSARCLKTILLNFIELILIAYQSFSRAGFHARIV